MENNKNITRKEWIEFLKEQYEKNKDELTLNILIDIQRNDEIEVNKIMLEKGFVIKPKTNKTIKGKK